MIALLPLRLLNDHIFITKSNGIRIGKIISKSYQEVLCYKQYNLMYTIHCSYFN